MGAFETGVEEALDDEVNCRVSPFQSLAAEQSACRNSGVRLECHCHLRFAVSEAARNPVFCIEEMSGHIVSKFLRGDYFVVDGNVKNAASLLVAPVPAVQAHWLVGKDFHDVGDRASSNGRPPEFSVERASLHVFATQLVFLFRLRAADEDFIHDSRFQSVKFSW